MSERQVMIVAECTISPGRLDDFKKIAQETIDAIKAGSKVLEYRWYFNSDQTKCYIVEQYADPKALIHHLEILAPHLLKILKVSKMTRFEIYGSLGPLESVEHLLNNLARVLKIEKLEWNPQNLAYWDGFGR